MHHRHKIDSPSGTAIGLGEAAAAGRKTTLPDVANWGRNRGTGKRSPGEIGFASLRGGEVVGEHKVIFAGNSERIELGHTAYSRELFAKGAVIAAKWANHKEAGLYDMIDVLGMGE
jgi:4-hydroxy-tetrahydrodipicolinate reductase